MSLRENQRLAGLVQSEIRAMTLACTQVQGINLAQGVCDTGVPPVVVDAAKQAMDHGFNTYTRYDGLAELRQALAQRMGTFNHMTVNSETEVTVSAGATGAFHCVCMGLLQPGDEVILFEPYYGYHLSTILAVEAVPRIVSLQEPDWFLSMEVLEEAITGRTKAIVVNTPGNPSGKVFTIQELEEIGAIARRHDLFIFTDEIYEYFVYDNLAHVSLASLPDMADRTVTISGYSKTFGITGWRIGHAVSAPRWASMIGAMNDLVYVCAPAPLQYGVAVGIQTLGEGFYQELQRSFQCKRDQFCQVLQDIGLSPTIPQGAYYVLADVRRLPGRTGKERAMYLLEKTGVAGVPGEAFFQGDHGARYIRFSFAKTNADLDMACERLQRLG
ncbi:MAG: pyridoxal phosphate-dependent aminotransferase [Nitrospirota bacterium]